MVEVRIRLASDGQGKHLGEVPFTDDGLDSTLRLVESWGIQSTGPDYPELIGQFVLGDTGAYFEVIICEDE